MGKHLVQAQPFVYTLQLQCLTAGKCDNNTSYICVINVPLLYYAGIDFAIYANNYCVNVLLECFQWSYRHTVVMSVLKI